jgi:hypothetical protein
MRYKKIIGFGDSWMWGDELLDPDLHKYNYPGMLEPTLHHNTFYRENNCFLGLVGQRYGIPTLNFGIAGGSLQSSIWTYLWWLEHETEPIDECLILVALTSPDRWSFYNPNHVSYEFDPPWNRFVHGSWVHSDSTCYSDQWASIIKNLFVVSDCQQLQQLNFDQAVYFFQGQSAINNKNILQFRSADWPISATRSVSSIISPDLSLATLIRQDSNWQQLLAPKHHPNEQGHKLIAHHLINYIDSYIIKE